MFSCEFCEIFKNTLFYRIPPVATSDTPQKLPNTHAKIKAGSKFQDLKSLNPPVSILAAI